MPGIQTLERVVKNIPMQSGQPERIEYEYRRYGTLCLIGNWDVVLGPMVAPTVSETRTEEDFARHVQHTLDLHRPTHDRQNCLTPSDLAGELGKPPRG